MTSPWRTALVVWAVLLTAALEAAAAPERSTGDGGLPWYERKRCEDAARLVYSGDPGSERVEAAIKQIEASRDHDDQACGVWLRMEQVEFLISWMGRTKQLLDRQEHALGRMFGFARAHRARGARFHDLEMEARMRRIRILFAAGKKTDAVREAQRVKAMLDEKRTEPLTPTWHFVYGNVNCVIAFSNWAIRALLQVAGLPGDGEVGVEKLKQLQDSKSVYRWEALYVARHFSDESPDSGLERSHVYSARLSAEFPDNPQFAIDAGNDLRRSGLCDRAIGALTPRLATVEGSREVWPKPIRAKLYWLSGACSLEVGRKDEARKLVTLAKAEGFAPLDQEIDELSSKL